MRKTKAVWAGEGLLAETDGVRDGQFTQTSAVRGERVRNRAINLRVDTDYLTSRVTMIMY